MFDVCTTVETAHIVTIFKLLPHTRQHGCIDILHCCKCLYHARMVLSVGRSFAYFVRNACCTVTTDLLVWYSNTQNDFSLGAAILSLHTLASPSGRNVNYDEKQLSREKNFWVVFVIPEYILKRPSSSSSSSSSSHRHSVSMFFLQSARKFWRKKTSTLVFYGVVFLAPSHAN
jgi:hypothetical protein